MSDINDVDEFLYKIQENCEKIKGKVNSHYLMRLAYEAGLEEGINSEHKIHVADRRESRLLKSTVKHLLEVNKELSSTETLEKENLVQAIGYLTMKIYQSDMPEEAKREIIDTSETIALGQYSSE